MQKKLDETIAKAATAADDALAPIITDINSQLTAVLPLRAKRRGQAAVSDFQSRQKAASKTSKSAGANVDAIAVVGEMLSSAPSIGPGKLVVGEIAGASDDQLRSAIDSVKKKSPSSAVLLAAAVDGKVSFIAVVSDDLIAKGLKAGDWVREAAKVAGGGGGGRPQMAQAGGKDPAKLGDALNRAREFATSLF